MRGTLTEAQRKVLKQLAQAEKPLHIVNLRTRKDVMERLEKSGLIHSASPFSYAYYSVSITDAGRSALVAA